MKSVIIEGEAYDTTALIIAASVTLPVCFSRSDKLITARNSNILALRARAISMALTKAASASLA
jgi:hypothetical protein